MCAIAHREPRCRSTTCQVHGALNVAPIQAVPHFSAGAPVIWYRTNAARPLSFSSGSANARQNQAEGNKSSMSDRTNLGFLELWL
jgi:hypothetical protein